MTKDKSTNVPAKTSFDVMRFKDNEYLSKRSKNVFRNTFLLWMIEDDEINKKLCKFSSKSLFNNFTDQYLHFIDAFITEKYGIVDLMEDYENEMNRDEIFNRISEIKDAPICKWLKEECLPKLDYMVETIHIENKSDIAKLGAIEDLMYTSLKLAKKNSKSEIHLYDVLYQLEDQLNNENFLNKKKVTLTAYDYTYPDGTSEFIYTISNITFTE